MTKPKDPLAAISPPSRAVPQWPCISPDGRAGGFVKSASRRPGHGVPEGNDDGVFAGPLDGFPQRLDCGVPSAPPIFDNSGRRLLLCHDLGEFSRISVRPPRPRR